MFTQENLSLSLQVAPPFAELAPADAVAASAIPAGLAVGARRLKRPTLWRRMLRQQRPYWFAILAVFEFGLLALATLLTQATYALIGFTQVHMERSWLLVVSSSLAMIALGLYQRHSEVAADRAGVASRITVALAGGAILSLLVELVVGRSPGPDVVLPSLFFAGLLLTASRTMFSRVLGESTLRRRTLFLGAGARACELSERMKNEDPAAWARSVEVVGYVPLPSDKVALTSPRRLQLFTPLSDFAFAQHVDEIVIAADDRRANLPMDDLVNCRLFGIEVRDLDQFYERETGKATLDLILPSWCIFTSAFNTTALRNLVKRCFDVNASLLLMALTWPLMLGVAIAIFIESRGRGPLLYAQERVGRHGWDFRLYKFRSMRTDAELDGIARWAQTNDSRVTRVGRVIRKFRLDELPQLWNVLKGQMSIVGPRPERPQFVDELESKIPNYGLRHCVRPGLAGWAQLRYPYGASAEDAAEKLRYDLFYVKFHSLRFDLLVLLQTVEVVLFGRGAR